MEHMTDAEWREFVLSGTRTAKVATTRKDGRPHVAPVWFLLDGGDLVFTTGERTVKGRALRAGRNRVAICVEDDAPPFSFVVLEGEARYSGYSDDPGALLHWATRIAGRYMGPDRAEVYGRRNGVPGELLVRVRIDKAVAQRAIAE